MKYASELLESVKENFYVPEAVDDMAECCSIIAKEFGETDIKCAEPYFYYGKALLEMSRLEAEVLGHAMEGIDIYAEDSVHPKVNSEKGQELIKESWRIDHKDTDEISDSNATRTLDFT